MAALALTACGGDDSGNAAQTVGTIGVSPIEGNQPSCADLEQRAVTQSEFDAGCIDKPGVLIAYLDYECADGSTVRLMGTVGWMKVGVPFKRLRGSGSEFAVKDEICGD